MAQYKAIINATDTFPLFFWDSSSFHGNPQLHLATDDLSHVKSVLEHISQVQIVDEYDNEVGLFTEYDGFSSISYMGRNYSGQMNAFANELVVTLTKISLVEQVQRLDEQINPVIDYDAMDLDEFKEWKIDTLSEMGELQIFSGTNVELTDGTVKNFTYDLEDQSNLLNAMFIIQALEDLSITIPYHGHGEPCELYSALDILAVYIALQIFSTTVQTIVNMKINWVRECETKDEVAVINFDTPLPEKWQEKAEAILGPSMEIVNALKEKYFPSKGNTADNDESNVEEMN